MKILNENVPNFMCEKGKIDRTDLSGSLNRGVPSEAVYSSWEK